MKAKNNGRKETENILGPAGFNSQLSSKYECRHCHSMDRKRRGGGGERELRSIHNKNWGRD